MLHSLPLNDAGDRDGGLHVERVIALRPPLAMRERQPPESYVGHEALRFRLALETDEIRKNGSNHLRFSQILAGHRPVVQRAAFAIEIPFTGSVEQLQGIL